MKTFLSLTRPHSRMCIRIYIFNFKKKKKKKKKKNKQTTTTTATTTTTTKKAKETNEEKRINLRSTGGRFFSIKKN